jgi:hypothetical protein
MKAILIFLVIANVQSAIGQTRRDTIVLQSEKVSRNVPQIRKDAITFRADSLNNYMSGPLPVFLFDSCFEERTSLQPTGVHGHISLRWEILKRVTNKKALKRALKNGGDRLKVKCGYIRRSDIRSEYMDKSFHELIVKRIKEL